MSLTAVVLSSFATGKLVEFVIGGIVGNRADSILCQSSKLVRDRIINSVSIPENHDILKAVRSSLIEASLVMLNDIIKERYGQGIKFFIDEEEYQLKSLGIEFKKSLRSVESNRYDFGEEPILSYQDIIEKGTKAEDHLSEIELSVWSKFISNFQLNDSKLSSILLNTVTNGWFSKNKKLRWFELVCAFFNEKLKTNHRVTEIIHTRYLSEISGKIENFQFDAYDFNNKLDLIKENNKETVESLQSILIKLDEIEKSLEDIKTQNDRIFDEVKLQSLTQREIIQILNNIYQKQTEINQNEIQELKNQNDKIIQTVDLLARSYSVKNTELSTRRSDFVEVIQSSAQEIFVIKDESQVDLIKETKSMLETENGVQKAIQYLSIERIQDAYQNEEYTLEECCQIIDLRISLIEPLMDHIQLNLCYVWILGILKDEVEFSEQYLNYFLGKIDNYILNGEFKTAINELDSLISSKTKLLDINPKLSAKLFISYAELWIRDGRLKESESWILQSEDIIMNLGNTDFKLQKNLNEIWARYYFEEKLFRQSLVYHQKVIEVNDIIGVESSEYASVYNNVGLCYYDMGELDDALDWFRSSLNLLDDQAESLDYKLAMVNSNIGLVYYDQAKYDISIQRMSYALKVYEKLLRPNHPQLALLYRNLASAYFKLNEIFEANFYIRKAKKIVDHSYDKTHPFRKMVLQDYKIVKNAIWFYKIIKPVHDKWKIIKGLYTK